MVLKVLFLYIPLPMFWALFDQQGSRWTLQATTMDGNFGAIQIQPDQMQTVNPILIIVLVPIVDAAVYPLIKKCNLNFTPLKRMTVGMFLAAMAFVAAALVQVEIDKTLPTFPSDNAVDVNVINLGSNNMTFAYKDSASSSVDMTTVMIPPLQASGYQPLQLSSKADVTYGNLTKPINLTDFQPRTRYSVLARNVPAFEIAMVSDITEKPEQGNNAIRFINSLQENINVTIAGTYVGELMSFTVSNYTMVTLGVKTIEVSTATGHKCSADSQKFGFGSSYTIVIHECSPVLTLQYIEDIKPNSVHMALQIPQYFLITAGEVVFSVTGLEFSYSQAPSNMKSVLQAGWLLTVAVGNIIVLIVAGASHISQQWAEYVLFAALLLAVCVIFAVMAYFYTYVDPAEVEAQFDEKDEQEKKKKEKELEALHGENGNGPYSQTKM